MWSERRGLWISMGSDFIRGPCAQHSSSVCLSWGRGVDFQGLLALLGDFPDSHVNLGQAVCSFKCGNIVCSPGVVQRPGGHWEGLTNGPKGNNNLAGLEEEGAMSSAGTPNSRASRGSAVHC